MASDRPFSVGSRLGVWLIALLLLLFATGGLVREPAAQSFSAAPSDVVRVEDLVGT